MWAFSVSEVVPLLNHSVESWNHVFRDDRPLIPWLCLAVSLLTSLPRLLCRPSFREVYEDLHRLDLFQRLLPVFGGFFAHSKRSHSSPWRAILVSKAHYHRKLIFCSKSCWVPKRQSEGFHHVEDASHQHYNAPNGDFRTSQNPALCHSISYMGGERNQLSRIYEPRNYEDREKSIQDPEDMPTCPR